MEESEEGYGVRAVDCCCGCRDEDAVFDKEQGRSYSRLMICSTATYLDRKVKKNTKEISLVGNVLVQLNSELGNNCASWLVWELSS